MSATAATAGTAAAAGAAARRLVRIKVVSDTIWPWCLVGKRKLEAAIRTARAHPKTAHLDFQVVWAPFQLDDTLPEAGTDKMARYGSRFGAERMQGMIESMKRVGRALAPPVSFSYGGLVANTIASHVVLEAALVEGGPELQDRVVERFFSHYFEKEGNIGDREALARMAADAGMEETRVRALLAEGSPAASAARALVLKTEAATKRRYRISGVPFFIVDEKIGVSGAQDPEAFLEIFSEIADE